MATKYLAKTFDFGVNLQSNWATPATNTSNYEVIQYNTGSVLFDPDVKVELFNTSGQGGIHKEIERSFVDGSSGLPTMSFTMPADITTLAPHLVGAFLSVTEGAASQFSKTITPAGTAGVVDFNGNDARLHTLAMNEKASIDDMIILDNCIIGNLNMTWDFNAKGIARLLQVDGNWVGNNITYEQNPSGTWATTTLNPLNDTDVFTFSTLSFDGVDASAQTVRRFTLNVANNVTTNSSTTGGKPNNYDITPVYTSTIILDYNATTEKLLKDFQDGALVLVTIDNDFGAGSVGNLTIQCKNGVMQKPPFIYNGDFAGIGVEVMWHSKTTALAQVIITFVDGIDWTY